MKIKTKLIFKKFIELAKDKIKDWWKATGKEIAEMILMVLCFAYFVLSFAIAMNNFISSQKVLVWVGYSFYVSLFFLIVTYLSIKSIRTWKEAKTFVKEREKDGCTNRRRKKGV